MAISIPIDGQNYDQKTQDKYCEIFERILGIKEGTDELNFFYIGKLKELVEAYEPEKYEMLQHYFGLNGAKVKDIGTLAQLIKNSFISEIILVIDNILKELKANRKLYDANLLVWYYNDIIIANKKELKKVKNTLKTEHDARLISEYNDTIQKLTSIIEEYSAIQKQVQKEYDKARKIYKKYS